MTAPKYKYPPLRPVYRHNKELLRVECWSRGRLAWIRSVMPVEDFVRYRRAGPTMVSIVPYGTTWCEPALP